MQTTPLRRSLNLLALASAFAPVFVATKSMSTPTTAQKPSKNTPKAPAKPAKKAVEATKPPQGTPYGNRADVVAFGTELAERRNLPKDWVLGALAQAQFLPRVQRLILPAAASFRKDFKAYRARFVEPVRLSHGVAFWQANAALLEQAEAEYGVPPHIVVGIIGIETLFGRDTGSYRVLDALATLTFDFPQAHPKAAARQAFFKDELEQFFSLCHAAEKDPFTLLGSYAGAIGMPQFMPSSWAKHAVDFDRDGKIDLMRNPADVIGSVARYLQQFNWQRGMPTHYPAVFAPSQTAQDKASLLEPDIVPSFEPADLSAKGMVLGDRAAAHLGKLALVEVFNGDLPPSYVLGTANFYAVTRYNWSSYYALTVIDYGEAVAQRMGMK
jgi:membrane-bound lytic murein transglycosylase B